MDEAKEVCNAVAVGAPFSLTTPLGIKRKVKLSSIVVKPH